MREKLWNLLDKTRYDYNFFQEYRQHLERVRIAVVIITSAVSFVVVGLSTLLEVNGVIWGLLILASGVASLVFDKLMIADKLTALKYFIPELNSRLDELQTEWINVNYLYEYEDDAIADIYNEISTAISRLTERYLDNLNFPDHKKSALRASEITKHWAEYMP